MSVNRFAEAIRGDRKEAAASGRECPAPALPQGNQGEERS